MQVPFIDLKAQYQEIKDEIATSFQEVLDSCQFILGPAVTKCEQELEEFTGVKKTWSCASGTDALVMALMALEVGPGDEVIVPGFSFFATAEAVSLVGATPVFIDIDPVTYNMDPALIEPAINNNTKAVIPVGLYGQPADMDEINAVAKKNNLYVIEDAAQSFGSTYKGRKSGALGTIGCTSFFPAKPLGCYGDGGAVFTDDEEIAEVLRQVRMHGEATRYNHVRLGINGRMDSLQCAVISVKLPKFPWEIERRQSLARNYLEGLQGLDNVGLPTVKEDRQSAWAQFTVRVQNRSELQEKLKEKGVPTAIHYPDPMYKQPAYQKLVGDLSLTHCEKVSSEVMSLPLHPYMKDEHQAHVIKSLREVL